MPSGQSFRAECPAGVTATQRLVAALIILSLALPPASLSGGIAEAPAEVEAPEALADQTGDPPPDPPADVEELVPPDGIPPVPIEADGGDDPEAAEVAATCVITGEVSDATTLGALAGVVIEVIGTDRTAESDAQGKFWLEQLPPGTYRLEINHLGYFAETNVVTAIEAQPAQTRFGLRPRPMDDTMAEYTLEEETVVGEYQGDSAGDFNLTLTLDSPMLTAGINRDDFTRAAVSDAGEAIAKVSGANIVDGKYAVVRGLADRYVTTTFNGAQIASADPSRKAVQLDLFPTNVIEAITVDKTYSPELSADFGGAAINILTRAFPEERILNFKFKTTYNTEHGRETYVHPGRSLGFFGNTGSGMPTDLESRDPVTGRIVFLPGPTTPPAESQDLMRRFHLSQSLLPKKDQLEYGYSYGLTYGETFDLANGMRLGFITSLAQSSSDSANTSEINNQNRSFLRDDYDRGVDLSAFASAALEINPLNSVQLTYFNKHAAKDTVTQGRRIQGGSQNYGRLVNASNTSIVRDTYGADAVYFREFWDIGTVERDLQIFQLKGNHRLSENGIAIDWNITESGSAETRPHSSHFEYGLLDFSEAALAPYVTEAYGRLDMLVRENADAFGFDPTSVSWLSARPDLVGLLGEETVAGIEANQGLPLVNGSLPNQLTIFPISGLIEQNDRTITAFRRTDSTEETASHRQISAVVPYYLDKDSQRSIEIGLGGSNLKKTRDMTARVFGLVTGETNGTFAFPSSLDGLGSSLAADPSGISDYFTGNINTGPYYGYGVGDAGVENISTVLKQDGIFLSAKLQINDFFMAGGLRHETERYEINVASAPLIPFTDAAVDALGWEQRDDQRALIPSLAAGTSLFGNSVDVLFSWSRTIARPTFWEFLPTTSTDQSSGIVRRGNVDLDKTTIDNFDLSAALRPTDSLTLRASLFHKRLNRPLVQVFSGDGIIYRDSAGSKVAGDLQDYSATINGIELEAEVANLGPFSLKGNFTYIDAVLNYFFEGGGQVSGVNSQLPFQPAFIANAMLGYEYEPWNFSATIIYNLNGSYPVILKQSEAQSEVTRLSLSTFDLVMARRFEKHDSLYTLRGGVKNLLGAKDRFVFDGKTYSSDNMGRSIFLEAEIAF